MLYVSENDVQDYQRYWDQDHSKDLAREVWGLETTDGLKAVPLRIYGDGADVFGC